MKKVLYILIFVFAFSFLNAEISNAQCSICARTAQQMGEKPAKALNGAILYLMVTPFAVAGFIGYRWWKSNKDPE